MIVHILNIRCDIINTMRTKGFSLVELLLYVAIMGVVVGLFAGILNVATRVQVRESAATEVSSQLNFITQTIQRLVRESSAVMVNCSTNPPVNAILDNDKTDDTSECPGIADQTSLIGNPQPVLRLRMKDSAGNPTDRDPIVIWKDAAGRIKMRQGTGVGLVESDLTTDKVQNPSNELTFAKYANYPGHDVIQINLTLNYNSTNPQSQIVKKVETAVGRVSAATFDSALLPGTGTLGIGSLTSAWENLFVNNILSPFKQASNYDGASRGLLVVGANVNGVCNDICGSHTDPVDPGRCAGAWRWDTSITPYWVFRQADCNLPLSPISGISPGGGICWCK